MTTTATFPWTYDLAIYALMRRPQNAAEKRACDAALVYLAELGAAWVEVEADLGRVLDADERATFNAAK